MGHLIEIRDLHKTYAVGGEPVHALDGVSVTIDKGELPDLYCGQHQRVAIARADERTARPFRGRTDGQSRHEEFGRDHEPIYGALERGHHDHMVTHEDDIAAYAKRHLVMKDGKLIRDDRRNET